MKAWWDSLQPRERRTLALGGLAVLVMLAFFLVWRPLHQRVDALDQRVVQQRETLNWMREAAAEVLAYRGQSPAGPDPADLGGEALYSLADRSARQAGLGDALQRVEPAGEGRVRVTLEQASFDELLNWLQRLERDFAIAVDPVSLRRGDSPGRVNGQLVLRRPAA